MSGRDIFEVKPTYDDLLAEVIELRAKLAASEKPAKGALIYPKPFEDAWEAYPSRPGANKKATYKAWVARINAGETPDVMLAGAKRYAGYVAAERTEQRFIKQPATFFGPDEHYKLEWTTNKTQPAILGKAGQATANAAQEWLRRRHG